MKITEKLVKPVKEANYLNVENTGRYRSIIRLFYINYEKLKYWMYQEEVYQELIQDSYFDGYTMEQCQQDLSTLNQWGNLLTIQDTKKVTTIEEFKNKKFRYQLSEYAVEIERMVVHLENLFVEGASLEPTLLERIRNHFSKLGEIGNLSDERLYGWWSDLKNDFVRLNQNYQDYMRTLNSVKAEEMMKTTQFLAFKDHLIEYLRSFVKSLQMNVGVIEQSIRNIAPGQMKPVLERITAYELTIPRMDVELEERQIRENIFGRWESIAGWFVSGNGSEAESGKVFDTTNEIIRKITRYASRITESNNHGANRREEYRKLAEVFAKCDSLNDAHRLSSCVFGVEKPLHIREDFHRKTESINSGVYEEEPCVVTVQPRVRTYREKVKRTGIVDRTEQKAAARAEEIERQKRERTLLHSYIRNGRLDFSSLPVLEPEIRDVFLAWLSKALERKDQTAKTEDGRTYHIEEETGKRCVIQCTDGEFGMPAYTLIFEDME
jgi:uncharacterized protein (TIGR02677 family)